MTNDEQPDEVEVMDRAAELTPKQYMMRWLRTHRACEPGLALAEKEALSLDDAWQRCPDDEYVVWLATRPGVLGKGALCKFACFCVRQVWDLLTDQRFRTAVEVAERYADGLATDEELVKARDDAYDAFDDHAHNTKIAAGRAAANAAYSVESAAYVAAAVNAANAAVNAENAATYAANAASWAAWTTDPDGAYLAIRAEQSRWLREHATPNWGQKS